MNAAPPLDLSWPDEMATQAFAERMAACMQAEPQLAHVFIALHGDLGAGKTTLVRHLLRALGEPGRIKSPTYAVVEPYELPGLNAWHFDFYRFNDPREWADAGFRDIFAGPGLKLAEWPDQARGQLPLPDLIVHLHASGDTHRHGTLVAATERGRTLLQAVQTMKPPPGTAP